MSPGGPSIKVTVQALHQLRTEVERQVSEAEQYANLALHRVMSSTGVPELDQAIQEFAQAWGRQMEQLARAGKELCAAIDHAARSYVDVDSELARMLMPDTSGGSPPDAGGATNPVLRGVAEGGQGGGQQ